MNVVRGRLEAPQLVAGDLEVRGAVAGCISICTTGRFLLHGVRKGDLWVDVVGQAGIRGIVNGEVINRSGKVSLFGLAEGSGQRLGGQTSVSSESIVRKGFAS